MSIRTQGKKLASNLTATVGILSFGAAGFASMALWYQTEQAKIAASNSSGITGSIPQQQPNVSQNGDDSGQQPAPVTPSQNFAPQAQSSGS